MKTIVVGSGKGGVGKSTVCINLAVALAGQGASVGLLDADIYGPSLPVMLGLRRLSPRTITDANGREIVQPFIKHGTRCMSIGFFVEEAQSVLWRGPMLHTALEKMIRAVEWGPLDFLFIDLPPGTGDIPISLQKFLTVDGAIAVTTPQEVAWADVIKAIHSFDQLNIPILGLVENMVGEVFGGSRGAQLSERLGIPFLGATPLDSAIRRSGDEGVPFVLGHPNSSFHSICANLEVPCNT